MREIKFRSAHYNFDGTFNGFSYWGYIDQFGKSTMDTFCSPTSRSGTERKFEEQFTGHLDTLSNPIYEGDVNQDDGKAVWNDDSCAFFWDYGESGLLEFENEKEWCIITSNIHQVK